MDRVHLSQYMEAKSIQATLGDISKNGMAKGVMLTCEDIAASQLQVGWRTLAARTGPRLRRPTLAVLHAPEHAAPRLRNVW